MYNVTVFMSTYNGEKYLREQIDSILNQKNVQVELIIRDDGSLDNTKNIIDEYSKKDERIKCIFGENLGYGKSFLSLFEYKEYESDYFAFSDQDDIWLPNKLNAAINMLERCESTVPAIYFSNMINVDSDLNTLGFKDFGKIRISLGSVYVRQRVAGCTMVFNKKLLNMAQLVSFKCYSHHISHEWIYLLCLALNGNVVHDSESYILYRRHNSATTSIGQGFRKRIKSEFKQMNKTKNDKYYLSQLLEKNYSHYITERNLKSIKCIAHYKNKLSYRLKLIFGRFLNSGNLLLNIRIKFFVLIGKF